MDQSQLQRISAIIESLAREGARDSSPEFEESFKKAFRRDAGLDPAVIFDCVQKRHISSFAEAKNNAPFSGPSFSSFVTCRFSKPGDAVYKGRGLHVFYGFHPSVIGILMVAVNEQGLCYLGFPVEGDQNIPVQRMRNFMPYATVSQDKDATAQTAEAVIKIWSGKAGRSEKLPLDLHGTSLQISVWEALLGIPARQYETYGSLAKKLGRPKAARAIGNAVGANPVSVLIPCHRVIRSTGIIDNYGWGSARKKILLGLEYLSDFTAARKEGQE